jgi:hypothetical protein
VTGRRVLESLDLHLVQTGRDLLRPALDHTATGLVAVAGVDWFGFWKAPIPRNLSDDRK